MTKTFEDATLVRKRRESLARERDRLVRAIESGALTEKQAAPMLADVRQQLESLGAE